MNRTIGGYIQVDSYRGEEYHRQAYRFNLGRSAFLFAVLQRGYRKMYLPYFCCDCMMEVLSKSQIEYEYYSIDEMFRPILTKRLNPDEGILIINYFGILSKEDCNEFYERYHNIILDNTQAFYSERCGMIDTIYTCRKWFGVADGAYLYGDEKWMENYQALKEDCSAGRLTHLWKKYENPDGDYYEAYSKIEEDYGEIGLLKMSMTTENMLRAINYTEIAKRRWSNFNILKEKLDFINELCIQIESVPFMYPIYVTQAKKLRQDLKKERCFTPILWPNVLQLQETVRERKLSEYIVYLPCDQRYDREDMEWMSEYILQMLKG